MSLVVYLVRRHGALIRGASPLSFLESTGKPMTVQGFYFGRAVPAATVREWMPAEKNKPPVSNNMYDHRGFRCNPSPEKLND